MKIFTEITLTFDNEKKAKIVFQSLEPDLKYETWDRARKDMRLISNKIKIEIDSTDLNSFRIMNNSIADKMEMILGISKLVNENKE